MATYVLADPHAAQGRDDGEQRAREIGCCERACSGKPDCQGHGRYGK